MELLIENKHFDDLNPILFGYNKCQPDFFVPQTIRPYYLLQYVFSGEGKLWLNDTYYHVCEHQLFIAPSQTKVSYQADSINPWHVIWIGITGKLSEQLLKLPTVIDCSPHLFQSMLSVFELDSMHEEYLVEKLFCLYRHLFSKQQNTNHYTSIYNYIENNYMNPEISVEQIAVNLHLNRSYISRAFKQNANISIQECIIKTRIIKACSFLKQGHTVNEVALLVGYKDVSNFSKIFKKYIGISPLQYKKQ